MVTAFISQDLQRNRIGEIDDRFILRNWFMWSWGLANLKYAGQANRLKTQGRVDVAV